MRKLHILHLEDKDTDAFFIKRALQEGGYEVEWYRVVTERQYISALDTMSLDAILADHVVPGYSSQVALEAARKRLPNIPFILVSGTSNDKEIRANLDAGANEFVQRTISRNWRPLSADGLKNEKSESPNVGSHDMARRFKVNTRFKRYLSIAPFSITGFLRGALMSVVSNTSSSFPKCRFLPATLRFVNSGALNHIGIESLV